MSGLRILSKKEELELLMEVGGIDGDGNLNGRSDGLGEISLKIWKERRNLIAVLLMLDAGLRVGEAVRVTYDDVYHENEPAGVMVIRKEIAKGRKPRTVPISERLRKALRRFNQEPYLFRDWPRTQCMIAIKPQKAALTTRAIQKMVKRSGQRACGIDVNPHMLRHTLATRLMMVTDIRTVQIILGHKNVNTTQIYTHPSSEDARKAIEALSTEKPVGVKLLGKNKEENHDVPEKTDTATQSEET